MIMITLSPFPVKSGKGKCKMNSRQFSVKSFVVKAQKRELERSFCILYTCDRVIIICCTTAFVDCTMFKKVKF